MIPPASSSSNNQHDSLEVLDNERSSDTDSEFNANHHHHPQQRDDEDYLTRTTTSMGGCNCDRPCTPAGVAFFGTFFTFNSISAKRTFHKSLVLCVTFLAYTCYHMGRRPLSIVKNVLNRNCSDVHHVTLFDQDEDMTYLEYEPVPALGGLSPNPLGNNDLTVTPANSTWCDWAPFDNDATANQLLALLDSAFLFSYAFFMFFSGFLADRCNLRYFLSGGMILSGMLLYAFGLSFYLNIHSMTYFVIIQLLSGAVQTTGWPAVVTCVGNWFDQSSRGSIFGLWNSNTNLGNIMGAVIAGFFVERSWGLSFIVPGFIMSSLGIVTFLFLAPRPEDVNLHPIKTSGPNSTKPTVVNYRDQDIEEAMETLANGGGDDYRAGRRKLPRVSSRDSAVSNTDDSLAFNHHHHHHHQNHADGESSPLISSSNSSLAGNQELADQSHAVSFWTCLAIPGVIEYSLCLGFAKLVSYTFLYWLPRYITQSTLNNSEDSAYLSVPFDIGGMFGAIVAGYLCDRYKKSALTCVVMLILAMPSMLIYEQFASISNLHNVALQLLTGFMVNGPYALITTAVSTDLGSRIKSGKAMATVAAIIDGTGSIGAAIGPLFAGYISAGGWQSVFMMLMLSDLLAALCLSRVFLKEIGLR